MTKQAFQKSKVRSRTRQPVAESTNAIDSNLRVAQLHAELHGLIMMPADDSEIRESFRKRTMNYCGATGVANITQEDGNWDLRPGNSTGRVPRRNDFMDRFAKSCSETIRRNSIQMESFLGLQAVFVPVQVAGLQPEVILILTKETDYEKTLFFAGIILEYFSLWLKERASSDNGWKLNSLAALIELVSKVESTVDRYTACQTVVDELVRYLGCEHAAIGLTKSSRVRLTAIAGQTENKTKSAFKQSNEIVLSESKFRNEMAVWSKNDDETSHLLLGHQQLAQAYGFATVVSTPLITPDGDDIGALLIASRRGVTNERLAGFLRASAPRIACSIEVVKRAESSFLRRLTSCLASWLNSIKGLLILFILAATVLVLCLPVPYRIRSSCVLNSASQRYSVAPFDGLIRKLNVEAGDQVVAGQTLAAMDGHAIRYELASNAADLAKANKMRDIELNQGNIPQSMVAELEAKSLEADKKRLLHDQSQILIRSQIDGVVLSEQTELTDGASVKKGDVLFEVGSFNPIVVEANIPADEVAFVSVGQKVKIWIDGFETTPIESQIKKLSPKSEIRDGRNVFISEFEIENPELRMRPGMQGRIRIDTEPKSLAWNLFHKPISFVKSQFVWW